MSCAWSTLVITRSAEPDAMVTAVVLLLMPVLLTVVTLAVGERLEPFPNSDDLWQLPRRSAAL